MSKKISVIVPIYNSEQFISKCIESIIKQTYKNIEIILINDGSRDKSEEICLEYAKKDKRIQYYKQKNSGVAAARNLGIKNASGDYFMFVDSDDYIDRSYINNMVKVAIDNQSDFVVTGYQEVYENGKRSKSYFGKNKNEIISISQDDFLNTFLRERHFNSSCWKILSKDLINNNNRLFNEKITYGEDFLFSFETYYYARNPIYLENDGYCYVMNDSSAMHTYSIEALKKYYSDIIAIYKKIKDKYHLSNIALDSLCFKIFYTFNGISKRMCKCNISLNEKKNIISNNVEIYREILNNRNVKKSCTFIQKTNLFLLKNKLIYTYIFLKSITNKFK